MSRRENSRRKDDRSDCRRESPSVTIVPASPEDLEKARQLAERMEAVRMLPASIMPAWESGIPDDGNICLRIQGEEASLHWQEMDLRGDFSHLARRLSPGNLSGELLIRAAGMGKGRKRRFFSLPGETDAEKETGRKPLAVDATAGMGEDSLLLAAAGFRVVMCESNPVIAMLLRSAMSDALREPQEDRTGFAASHLREAVLRMELMETDSIGFLASVPERPDVIYLDPMFPQRTKQSLVGKKFQLLHQLEAPCCREEELLEAAVRANPRRIVIKRPAKGEWLAGRKPEYSLKGSAVRYDCLIFHG